VPGSELRAFQAQRTAWRKARRPKTSRVGA